MSSLYIHDAIVVTMDDDRRVLDRGAILVRDGVIAAIGEGDELEQAAAGATRIDAARMVAMPGLIDSHGHAGHALVKSLGAGDAEAWVEACLRIYARGSSVDFWRAEARLASLERLKAGVTTSVSLLGGGTDLIRNDSPEYALAYADAVGECGTRAYVAVGPNRPPYPHHFVHLESGAKREADLDAQMEVVREAVVEARGKHDDRVRLCLCAPVFTPDRSDDGLAVDLVREVHERVMALRAELDVLHTQDGHRGGTLAFAREMDALGPWSLMSHSVELTGEDMDAVRAAGTTIIHNPSAIMSIRGRCPVPELIDLGVRVVLGSDAAAPDRGYDMFRHMAQCMHYHRRHFRDAGVMPAGKVLEMATIDAAHGLGRADELGSLEPGKRADVVLVDLFKPHLVPVNMPVMRLAHFANAADVDTVIVDGRVLMRGRRVLTIDESTVLEDAEAQMTRVIQDNDLQPLLSAPAGFWGASGLGDAHEPS